MSDVYYEPDKFGLKIVAELDYSSGEYEFDLRVVWQDEQGQLWTGRDSGCSCFSPFQDQGKDSLEPYNEEAILAELHTVLSSDYKYINMDNVIEFLTKIQEALHK